MLWGCAGGSAGKPLGLDENHREPDLVSVRHRVGPGQTLYRIAQAYGVDPDELAEANGIDDPRELREGTTLVIFGAKEVLTVAPGGSGEERSVREATGTPRPPPRPQSGQTANQGKLDWPLRGVLYARFGKKGKEPHDGIDLAAPQGTPVKAARAGEVVYAGEQKGYGLIVIVSHAEELVTLYAHNRDLRVKTGQKVRDGQVVATVGESGRTSGPHLHFEVRKAGVPVDPLEYLGGAPPK